MLQLFKKIARMIEYHSFERFIFGLFFTLCIAFVILFSFLLKSSRSTKKDQEKITDTEIMYITFISIFSILTLICLIIFLMALYGQ